MLDISIGRLQMVTNGRFLEHWYEGSIVSVFSHFDIKMCIHKDQDKKSYNSILIAM